MYIIAHKVLDTVLMLNSYNAKLANYLTNIYNGVKLEDLGWSLKSPPTKMTESQYECHFILIMTVFNYLNYFAQDLITLQSFIFSKLIVNGEKNGISNAELCMLLYLRFFQRIKT